MTSGEKYWIGRAENELEKAKRIYHNLNKLPEEGIMNLLEKLLNVMNFLARVLLIRERKIREFAFDTFTMLDKGILKSYKIEETFYELYFYIRSLLSKGLTKVDNGYLTKSWKAKKVITKKQIYDFISEVREFIDQVEERIDIPIW